MQAIVITFDRFATRLLGCYGNEWVETPHLDRLASTATVFDDHFVDTVGPNRGRAWLTGRSAIGSEAASTPLLLGDLLRAAGVSTRAITCDGTTFDGLLTAGFDRHESVRGIDGLDVNPNEVPIAKLVHAGVNALNEESQPDGRRLLWLHAPEPGLPPEGFATLYFEDFEERGAAMADISRDDWNRQLAVAGGSVSLVDHWLGVLIQQIESASPQRPTLILIAAAGGRAWMDSFIAASPSVRRASPVDKLRDQETRGPLILAPRHDTRFAALSSIRSSRFVQPIDLLPTLLDWFDVRPPDHLPGFSLLKAAIDEGVSRDAIIFGDEESCLGIRTRKWNCLARVSEPGKSLKRLAGDQEDADAGMEQVQLFVKPDDIWDVTDISTQYPSICDYLLRNLEAIRDGRSDGQLSNEAIPVEP